MGAATVRRDNSLKDLNRKNYIGRIIIIAMAEFKEGQQNYQMNNILRGVMGVAGAGCDVLNK